MITPFGGWDSPWARDAGEVTRPSNQSAVGECESQPTCQTLCVNAEQPHLMLLDTASLYYRSFFGIPEKVQAPDGTPVNAVRGLLDSISLLVSQYRPDQLVCCWDNDWRPKWRVELIPSYKQHRVADSSTGGDAEREEAPASLEAQVPIILEVLEAIGIPVVGVDGFEADDVIGSLSSAATGPVNIVTGDRDLFQLADDARCVQVLYTGKGVGKHEVITSAEIHARYGVTAAQYVDFAVLRGDPSDGLPGVKGIGDKTAARLLNEYGSLNAVQAAASDPESSLTANQRAQLNRAESYLANAPRVVRVTRDLAIPKQDLRLVTRPRDPQSVALISQRWGLDSPVQRLLGTLAN